MADEQRSGKNVEEKPSRLSFRLPTARQVGFGLFGLLFAAGIAFYLWWGLAFHVWIDNGVYAVVSTLTFFGLAGMWLTLPPRRASVAAA